MEQVLGTLHLLVTLQVAAVLQLFGSAQYFLLQLPLKKGAHFETHVHPVFT